MNELLKRLRRFEIIIRRAVNSHLHGSINSVFKGTGIEFDDVRAYQYGDDVRSIDWINSAKGHGVFVKTFKEEREQTVFFMLDVSASQALGQRGLSKSQVAKEVCGVLSLSAIVEGSQVGLYCFAEGKERYIQPEKGMPAAYRLVKSIMDLTPKTVKTNIQAAIFTALKMLKRRSVVVLISDFVDTNYEASFAALARMHDLVVVHVYHPMELDFPRLGIVPLFDREKGKKVWMNTSAPTFRAKINQQFEANRSAIQQLCRRSQVNYVSIDITKDYIPPLLRMFAVRNRSRGQRSKMA